MKNFFAFLALLTASTNASALGSLMVDPTRVVFEKNVRAYQVDISNTGAEAATYRITLENKRMTPEGSFVLITKPLPGELTADKIVQYSPRQVTLAPGAGQTVRVVLRKPADLPVGEYRSHLVFSRLPDAQAKSVEADLKPHEIGIQLTPLIGLSIPIIVEHGETSATATLKDLKFIKATQNDPAILQIKIERSGNRSVYGDLTVHYTPKGESEVEVTTVRGVAVYSPNPFRFAKLDLQSNYKKPITSGKLTVKFNEARDAGGKLLTEASIEIP